MIQGFAMTALAAPLSVMGAVLGVTMVFVHDGEDPVSIPSALAMAAGSACLAVICAIVLIRGVAFLRAHRVTPVQAGDSTGPIAA